ncbi:MAG TPA: TetR/AcrR family transcriptional regulator [Candidatus Bathyarchaeia archaeon]|nr:TetR/AcrR family transcriptional regulator [Candidatus Bathyarchaeia archaeon]
MTTAAAPRSTGSSGSARGSRMTADERRDAIVAAATEEFATGGLVGASTEAIARRVGVSQPYVFQLFGTKKDLFLAVVGSCFARIILAFEGAADRWTPGDETCNSALLAMGLAYKRLLADRTLLLMQLQAYAACSDPDVRTAVREGWARLYRRVSDASGASKEEIHQFFAEGMLLNLGAAVGLPGEATTWTLEMFEEAGR